MCCVCGMVCNHVGPHAFCAAHQPAQEARDLFRLAEKVDQTDYRAEWSRAVAEKVALEAEVAMLKAEVAALEERLEEVRAARME